MDPSTNSTHNTQRNFVKLALTKIVSVCSKDKAIPLETMNSIPPTDTSVSLPAIDYNNVEDMKNTHENISLLQLTKIMSQWDILLRALGETSTSQATSSNKGSSKSHNTLAYVLNMLHMEEANSLYPPFFL